MNGALHRESIDTWLTIHAPDWLTSQQVNVCELKFQRFSTKNHSIRRNAPRMWRRHLWNICWFFALTSMCINSGRQNKRKSRVWAHEQFRPIHISAYLCRVWIYFDNNNSLSSLNYVCTMEGLFRFSLVFFALFAILVSSVSWRLVTDVLAAKCNVRCAVQPTRDPNHYYSLVRFFLSSCFKRYAPHSGHPK